MLWSEFDFTSDEGASSTSWRLDFWKLKRFIIIIIIIEILPNKPKFEKIYIVECLFNSMKRHGLCSKKLFRNLHMDIIDLIEDFHNATQQKLPSLLMETKIEA
jgi:hypothetical protein